MCPRCSLVPIMAVSAGGSSGQTKVFVPATCVDCLSTSCPPLLAPDDKLLSARASAIVAKLSQAFVSLSLSLALSLSLFFSSPPLFSLFSLLSFFLKRNASRQYGFYCEKSTWGVSASPEPHERARSLSFSLLQERKKRKLIQQ